MRWEHSPEDDNHFESWKLQHNNTLIALIVRKYSIYEITDYIHQELESAKSLYAAKKLVKTVAVTAKLEGKI